MELRVTPSLLCSCFMMKGCNSGEPEKELHGASPGDGAELQCPPQASVSQHPHVFTSLEAPQTLSCAAFIEASLPRQD